MFEASEPEPLNTPGPRDLDVLFSYRLSEAVGRAGIFLSLITLLLILVDYTGQWHAPDMVPELGLDLGVEIGRQLGQHMLAHTNPVTLLALALALAAILHQTPLRRARPRERLLWGAVLVLCAGYQISADITAALFPDMNLGRMSWNTALGLGLLGCGQLLRHRYADMALLLCLLAMVPPMVGLNGLILGQTAFHGHMAPTTALALLGLTLGTFPRFARHRFVRLLLKNNRAGRLTRLQLAIWIALDVVLLFSMNLLHLHENPFYPIVHTVQILLAWSACYVASARVVVLLDSARRTQKALRGEMYKDHLTGLATRRAAARFFQDAPQSGEPISLVLIDIDHFKQINDLHGHAIGDAALRMLSDCLHATLRPGDLAVRWGGDEFLLILRGAPVGVAVSQAQGLRLALADLPPPCPEAQRITASMGITSLIPGRRTRLEDVVEFADDALYAAKSNGRDTIYVADPDDRRGAVHAADALTVLRSA